MHSDVQTKYQKPDGSNNMKRWLRFWKLLLTTVTLLNSLSERYERPSCIIWSIYWYIIWIIWFGHYAFIPDEISNNLLYGTKANQLFCAHYTNRPYGFTMFLISIASLLWHWITVIKHQYYYVTYTKCSWSTRIIRIS